MAAHRKVARVLFDEAHSEAWTIRPEVAEVLQPSHPADSSYADAAATISEREFDVAVNADSKLTPELLADVDVLVIAHPSEKKWEATVGDGSPVLESSEINAVDAFVRGGGGLIALGETEQHKYGNNLNDLLIRFGVEVDNATVQDYEHHREAPSWVIPELVSNRDGAYASTGRPSRGDVLARVEEVCFYRAGTLSLDNGARAIARTSASASPPSSPLAAITTMGDGHVAVLADSDLFGDDCIGDVSNRELWLNLVYWAAEPAFRADKAMADSAAADDPLWIDLRDAVAELRLAQEPDGSIDTAEHDPARLRDLVERIADTAQALKRHFPHQDEYIDALVADLGAWTATGFGKPDFAGSLEAFRPERDRADGAEHLVVFPMYKQNASRDVCFEALIVRVPWPDWVADLESRRYDNPKFVPITLVDYTDGYDSECAVLFPETVSTAERPSEYHFGGIFCDRESERFRRVCGRAADVLHLNLPPDAACLLDSPDLSRDAYVLWDLVHDRAHMHGDLPFDPFMIRQRSPYWMYSLEELRCDLTAYGEAVKLEREGFTFARYVQYAILLDRLFRFPVTGSRVRNYDGLGGQLVSAFLHKEGYLHWTDNELRIDWDRLADGVAALRERVLGLYHSGIDRSKLAQWITAHDLVAEYVAPAEGSRWAAASRDLPEVDEPNELVDLVKDDEFPLSLFYVQLRPKLENVLTRAGAAA